MALSYVKSGYAVGLKHRKKSDKKPARSFGQIQSMRECLKPGVFWKEDS
jgi:hypothetical protein